MPRFIRIRLAARAIRPSAQRSKPWPLLAPRNQRKSPEPAAPSPSGCSASCQVRSLVLLPFDRIDFTRDSIDFTWINGQTPLRVSGGKSSSRGDARPRASRLVYRRHSQDTIQFRESSRVRNTCTSSADLGAHRERSNRREHAANVRTNLPCLCLVGSPALSRRSRHDSRDQVH